MAVPALARHTHRGVTLLGDARRPGGVAFGFTERTGGVSAGCYASLNLGDACGDDPAAVAQNRRLALAALDESLDPALLINPRQVHGDHVVTLATSDPEDVARAQAEARAGADAVVCVAVGVPVLLCFADCVPVVLACEGGFAVIHSGWRGTIARIAAKALGILLEQAGASAREVCAYIGPHIAGEDYEVSQDLLERFVGEFGPSVQCAPRHLDLSVAVRGALEDGGVPAEQIVDCGVSTPRALDRFYSYRAEDGRCGRHGALAVLTATREA